LDIGGGWFPEDIQKDSSENFKKALALVPEFLPHVRELINEPGKALAQPSMAVAMQILGNQKSMQATRAKSSLTARLPNCRCIFSIRTGFFARIARAAIGNH
jgi:hypothetical protein